jgi:hypothetical protein
MGFCASWADGITMNFCNSVGLLFGLDVFQFGFLLLSSSSIFQSAAVPGRRNTISQPAQSPARCLQLSDNLISHNTSPSNFIRPTRLTSFVKI